MKKIGIVLSCIALFLATFYLGWNSNIKTEETQIYLEGDVYSFRDSKGFRLKSFKVNDVFYLPYTEDFLYLDYNNEKVDKKINLTLREEKENVDINTKTFDGERFTNDNLAENEFTLFVNWATWCPDCNKFLEGINGYSEELNKKGIKIVGLPVYDGEPEKVKSKIDKKMAKYNLDIENLVVTDEMKKELQSNITNIPSVFLVDKRGNIMYSNDDIYLLLEPIIKDLEHIKSCDKC